MNQGKSVAVQPVRPVLNFSALQRDVIRMVAFVAMVGDHIATAFQLDMPLSATTGSRFTAWILSARQVAPPILMSSHSPSA